MGVILLAKNITDSVRLDNMRKEFVANVSHELKTPLTSIKGYSETILAGGLNPEEQMQFTKVINNEANRMNKLVADLLKLSRFDYQKNNWNKTKFNLDDLAKAVVEKMTYIAKKKNHQLQCIVNIVPPPISADKDAIEQVITNLVSNSIKYTPDGGEINVYIGSIAGRAYLKVIDTGIGITEKDLSRIFERFYRVDKARSREMGGTGLGLSIVKEIVDGNGGTIEIKSEVEKGTEVIIIFEAVR
jgi:two-component system sensor histidine kinase VicK